MSKERYNQIMDEAYKNYTKKMVYHPVENWLYDENGEPTYRQLSQEEFINKCKIDQEFSERWGLKIEERELSLEERRKMANYGSIFISPMTVESWDRRNIPTKLITIQYNGEKIEVHE
jgi:hypothetical protein